MRVVGALVILLMSGCLAAPPAPELLRAESAPSVAAPAPDDRLRVEWRIAPVEGGEILEILIDASLRWPEPRCLMQDVMARGVPALPPAGGSAESLPASIEDGRYVCRHVVAQDAGVVVFSVTRPDAALERMRIHGPHVVPIDGLRAQRRAEFASFEVEPDAAGFPLARAEVAPLLASAEVPTAGPVFGWNATHAGIHVEALLADRALHMSYHEAPTWTMPTRFEASLDVPARAEAVRQEMREPFPRDASEAYVLAAFAYASNDVAFAISEPIVRGFGACADGSCFVRDDR